MRYLSPAWLFDGSWPQPLDKKYILQQRKRLLAELELNGESITIKGTQWTKNDIIQYFEQLQDEQILEWHGAIAADKTLQ